MKKQTSHGLVSLALCTAPLWMGAKECEIAVVDPRQSCVVDGKSYQVGTSFPDADGCNTCTCEQGGKVACTLIGCESDVCAYEGKTYQVDETFPAKDGCNTCSCELGGGVSCTEIGCGEPTDCTYEGVTYPVGETFPAKDGCNTCTCEESGISCTLVGCGTTCQYDGKTYGAGATFPSTDGCNSCSCGQDGLVSCTARACEPGCTLGDRSFPAGSSVLCADGCNVCHCSADSSGNVGWSSTDAACPTLPQIKLCDATPDGVQVKAVYLAGDALALNVSPNDGCEPPTFELCWDGSVLESDPSQVSLWVKHVWPGGVCSSTYNQDVVFDVSPLKQATGGGSPGTLMLNVGNEQLTYTH